ncbi:MAG: FimB/Mfa2 family fimbrial subunit [Tannerella sp.]|jgi:hypothetical protein|nr:FimB/Mfa2 family fimbrial subunit [Tannerella sp.]
MNIKYIQIAMKRFILPLCTFCLSFTACTLEEQIVTDVNRMETEARVNFSLVISSRMQTQTQTQTRAAALSESDENSILSVQLLMFKETGGVMTYYFNASGSNILTVSASQKTFDVTLPTGEYDVVVLANAQEIVDQSDISLGDTKENVLKALVETNAGKRNRNTIPMWGRVDRLNINAGTGLSNKNAVEMMRMLAKIDIEVASSATGDFTLTDVRLYNYSSQGALVPDMNNLAAGNFTVAPTQPSVAGGYAPASAPLVFDAGDGVTANECKRIIYICEAPAGDNANLSGNTCLVVGGSYKGGTITYYRIDFVGMANDRAVFLPLLRNSYYLVKIVSVSNNGYSTPEEALNSPPVNMETAFLSWTENGMNNVVFDGKYMLGVSASQLTFSCDAQTAMTAGNKLTVISTVPNGWEIEKITDQSGIPNTAAWISVSTSSAMSGVSVNIFVYTEKNTSSSERTGYIYISSGKLRYCVEVIQGTAPGFGLEVIDSVTFREITTLDFSYAGGQKNSFKVIWKPVTAKVTVTVSNPGTAFSGSGLPANNITLAGGSASYTITSMPVSNNRLTRIDFTLYTGVNMEVKTLFIRQKE